VASEKSKIRAGAKIGDTTIQKKNKDYLVYQLDWICVTSYIRGEEAAVKEAKKTAKGSKGTFLGKEML